MSSLIRSSRSILLSRLLSQQNGILRNCSIAATESQAKVVEERLQNTGAEISTDKDNATEQLSFTKMLRYSPFVQMGDPQGHEVLGTITETMGENIYVDFGAKFHCVCKKPRHKADLFVRGAKVRLRLADLELASKFMGSEHGITLREAEGVLLGLYNDPSKLRKSLKS